MRVISQSRIMSAASDAIGRSTPASGLRCDSLRRKSKASTLLMPAKRLYLVANSRTSAQPFSSALNPGLTSDKLEIGRCAEASKPPSDTGKNFDRLAVEKSPHAPTGLAPASPK